jgi:hypothetical protein
MSILLLNGWSGAGKDAVAGLLQGRGFRRLAFADPLKTIVAEELNLPVSVLHTQEGKQQVLPSGQTVRQRLIQRGQELRKDDPGLFARHVASQISLDDSVPRGYIITDWRLPIEILTLQKLLPEHMYTLLPIRVNRANHQSPVGDAYTEHQLDAYEFGITIENPGTTLEALEDELTKKLGALFA